MNFKTLRDFDFNGKKVLLRIDLNVPVQDGIVAETTRIDRVKPTIDYLIQHGAKIVIISHFGRPKGEVKPEFSLKFLTPVLEKQWGYSVGFGEDSTKEITLLENLRFDPGEEKNDLAFAKKLAAHGDIFINDAFSMSHRAHASTEAITHLLPCGAGLLMEAELKALHIALDHPEKPIIAIVGGSKISTKLSVLHNLVKRVNYLALGGGMANTFLLATGHEIGTSMCETDMVEEAKKIMATAKESNCEIILPIDCAVVEKLEPGTSSDIVDLNNFPNNKSAVDIGPKSIDAVCKILESCKTVLWNGPFGVFEIKPFDNGTNKVAQKVSDLTKSKKLVSIAGGGDTVSALDNAGVVEDFSYISTAGGAFLEWLEGKELPGVAALKNSASRAA
ncbi:MAG TPA: phosphoglycerate kinase [Alphaproteobacteria bacterium]|nr:phosphoglycerate kinase [Alphaproteobacteria bacterium]